MARPVVTQVTENLYEIMLPVAWEDERHDYALLKLCQALSFPLQEVHDYVLDEGTPNWSLIVDIDRAPAEALPWLAQFVGSTLPPQLSGESDAAYEARCRDYIRDTPTLKRGTPAAMQAEAAQFLIGTKTVMLRERTGGNAYQLSVFTWNTETPSQPNVLAALKKQKPAGIVLTYSALTGQDYQILFTNHPNYQDVYGDYTSYQGVFAATPGI